MFGPNIPWQRFKWIFWTLFILGLIPFPGCSRNTEQTGVLRLATTTSTRDSKLLDALLPLFERSHHCRVDVVAVGTGAALKIGESGDADIVMVHARQAEQMFMEANHGIRHEEFMYNNFVLLGPRADPAQIRDVGPIEAMTKIAEGEHRFISRGDDSGTHKRELSLWKEVGTQPAWDDYIESGQGMGPTLIMTAEKQGYALADRGTFLIFQENIELIPLAANADILRNPYAAIVVNPEKHHQINTTLANAFVDFLISEKVQRLIASHQISGQQLFHPTRIDETI